MKIFGIGNTGINVNAGYGGRTIIAICSGHGDSGDATYSAIDLLRLGYSGNHLTVVNIARSSATSTFSVNYSVNNGNIYISASQIVGVGVFFISNDYSIV